MIITFDMVVDFFSALVGLFFLPLAFLVLFTLVRRLITD